MSNSRPRGVSDAFVEAHALHPVDTHRANDGVWLVKVPKYLAELWQNAGPDGTVGKVVIASASPPSASSGGSLMGPESGKKPPGSQVTLLTDADLLSAAGEAGNLIPKEHQFIIQTSANLPGVTASVRHALPQTPQRRMGAMVGQELIILAEDDLAFAPPSAQTTNTLSATSNTSPTSSTVTAAPCHSQLTVLGTASPIPDVNQHSSSSATVGTKQQQVAFSNLPTARYSRRLSLFGRVNSRAECRPPPNARYMMLKAQQLKARNRPKHEVRLLYEPVRNYKPVSNHVNNIEYEARKKAEGKNLRREKEDVMQDLFKAFERHQYYAIKDLILLTKQPVSYLTEILKEIAIFNLRAPHKNMWELKPEYRHYTSKAD